MLSARVGSIGDNQLGGWYGYRAAKAAVNQIVHTAAIEIARTHKQAVVVGPAPRHRRHALHPRFRGSPTRRPRPPKPPTNLLAVLDGLTPADTGQFFDYAGQGNSMVTRLVLILGDQLTPDIAALAAADKATDVVVMAEVMAEATYVRHHPKKIAFTFAAMRKFAASLNDDGWQVAYTKLDDPDNTNAIDTELMRRGGTVRRRAEVLYTEPGEHRLIEVLAKIARQKSDKSPTLRRHPFSVLARRIRRLGRGPQIAADGVFLPRHAPQDRVC